MGLRACERAPSAATSYSVWSYQHLFSIQHTGLLMAPGPAG